ncbi:30981_t:CDS:2 [Gigaspora margarita]|uniref:30981_t:CDS:1 n=1 Tax=Gigaspora margarita TaxID=4874 RepID=A0ABM8W4H4_GIGMA|nr:30981_t:CDS:2 [Gigaspora margarita]
MKIIQIYSTLNIYLILFVALLAIILPPSKSEQTDPNFTCQNVSKAFKKNELVEYDNAKKCIESFPFDAKLAGDVINAVSHFMSNYYVFLNQAKEEPPKGFTYKPVDLIKELESLRKETFKSDYDFVVFDDKLDPSNNDCEVFEIDGKPALQTIIDFANDNIAHSKDLGVRFNMALAPRDKTTESTSSDMFKASASRNKNTIKLNNKHAKSVADNFYLINDGKVGVAVITDENTDIFGLADGLRQLNKRGAEKLILDMSNNIGSVDTSVSIFTTLLLFPSKKQPYFFPTSININNFTIPNASEFIGPLTNLTSSLHLYPLTPYELQLLNSTSPFRWTSDDIIILTNGFCVGKLKTIAVGGLLDTPMSFSTFPGGSYTSTNVIADEAGDNITEISRINALILTIREAYDFNNDNITTGVLEYLFKPADYKLYYNESNARDPSFLWVDAANILNKKL